MRLRLQSAGRRQQRFEIKKIGQQRLIVAFNAKLAKFGQRENIVEIWWRKRLPKRLPGLFTAADGERPRSHDEGTTLQRGNSSVLDRKVIGLRADFDHDVGVKVPAAPQQRRIAVDEVGYALDHRRNGIRT